MENGLLDPLHPSKGDSHHENIYKWSCVGLLVGDKVRIKRDERGISPIIATILLIAITAVAAGVIASYVAGLYVGGGGIPVTATVSGSVFDWDDSTVDNYVNGKVSIDVTIMTDDIDDVLDSRGTLSVTIISRTRGWSTGSLVLGDVAGLSEADYGSTYTVEAVIAAISAENGLYVKLTVPTSSGGDIRTGSSIRVDMWPTSDTAYALRSATSAASFSAPTSAVLDNETYWDQRDTIDLYITGRADSLTLTGFDGAYLFGTTST